MKPLSHKTRFSMFFLLSLIFVIGAPLLILYSTGYRLGDALSLVQTGGIFIRSDLADTRVFVDDDFVENNGLILRNTLIQNLRPNKTYHVRVEKDAYHTWEKDFRVMPNLVMEAQILMLPQDIQFREIDAVRTPASTTTPAVVDPEFAQIGALFSDTLEQFEVEVSTTTRRVIGGVARMVTSTSTEIDLPNNILDLDIEGLEKKRLLREKQRMVAWIEGGEVHVVWAGDESSLPYIFCSTRCAKELVVSYDEYISQYDFLPGRNDVLVILTQSGVRAIEIDGRSRPNVQPILEGRGLDFRIEDNNTIFIKDGEVFKEAQI